jgi:Dolichol phosphate-mannose biosynthesis regulatory protein (DPM2)
MASGDKLVGAGLVTLSASIFVYYTLWVLVLVS